MKPRIAITLGDVNGIGPEVVLKAIARPAIRRLCSPVVVGPAAAVQSCAKRLRMRVLINPWDSGPRRGVSIATPKSGLGVDLVESSTLDASQIMPGRLSRDAGAAAAAAIERAVTLALDGAVDAVVTAPVSKQALHIAGVTFPGQTELLQRLTGSPHVAMILRSPTLFVGLATIHVPIAMVPAALTREVLTDRIRTIHEALIRDWNIRDPLLAVLGLNPHAGEGGDLGREESDIIIPVLRELSAAGIRVVGPIPADGFFARYRPGDVDGVIAMYHDQGLIPLKMSSGGRAVNISVGLPIVRTSPDHGTGFDIAGKGKADPSSMIEAIREAVIISENRKRFQRRSR
jgi:4-phospho-D-threonate 3-dehydrogenase / 4-phospho-D-erythronate 3-dehydrogenase